MKKKDKVVIILDHSSSMQPFVEQVRREFKKTLDQLKSFDHRIDLTVIFFDYSTNIRVVIDDVPIQEVTELPKYEPWGNTALCSAVDLGIEKFLPLFKKDKKNAKDKRWSYLFITLTDGAENDSPILIRSLLPTKIKELQESDYWTFTFQVPRGYKNNISNHFGVHPGNVTEWEQTAKGYAVVQHQNSVGTQCYFNERSQGKMSTKTFYSDLSGVKANDLSKLDDLTWRFKPYKVDKELSINSFVEYKTGKPLVLGSAYYTLTKTEAIQDNKELVIRKVGEKDILGGKGKVRSLLGLPSSGTVKVTPKNHNGYEIFVQSKAPNRKLVRGTDVLVDKLQTTASEPTWK